MASSSFLLNSIQKLGAKNSQSLEFLIELLFEQVLESQCLEEKQSIILSIETLLSSLTFTQQQRENYWNRFFQDIVFPNLSNKNENLNIVQHTICEVISNKWFESKKQFENLNDNNNNNNNKYNYFQIEDICFTVFEFLISQRESELLGEFRQHIESMQSFELVNNINETIQLLDPVENDSKKLLNKISYKSSILLTSLLIQKEQKIKDCFKFSEKIFHYSIELLTTLNNELRHDLIEFIFPFILLDNRINQQKNALKLEIIWNKVIDLIKSKKSRNDE
eukprot:TRINITY_DN3747_c2_g4_i1.p1 TRINITY_DN3747_c2_g4~~TRINITY_DN3747_c2_g4_i1.p1  ORF type:complete len:279 (+),score=81.01 TRINITY_DN3747_c2_g4_i1:745-1581(+)